MALEILLNEGRQFAVAKSGYAFDIRPGINPDDFEYDHTYAWPKPQYFYGASRKETNRIASPISLLPAPLDPDWDTMAPTSGPLARYKLSDYSILSGTFDEYPRRIANDWVIVNKSTTGELKSIKPLPANRGLSILVRAFGPSLIQSTILSITFGSNNPAKAFTFNLNADGKGYLSRGISPVEKLAEGYLVPNRWGNVQSDWLKIFILPYNRNRILITSSAGGSFVWQDPKIARYNPFGDDPKDLITTLTELAHYTILSNQKAAHQIKPLAFTGTPSLVSGHRKVTGTLKVPSIIGASPYRTKGPSVISTINENRKYDYDLMSKVLKSDNVVASFTTNPVPGSLASNELRPTVSLSRPDDAEEHQHETPFFYRVETHEDAVNQFKPDVNENFVADIIRLSHSQDERGMSGTLRIKHAENHSNYKNIYNIPFSWKLNGSKYLSGLLTNPKFIRKGKYQWLEYDVQDLMKGLDSAPVADIGRLDGLAPDDAFKQILISLGFPKDGSLWDIDPIPTVIDRTRNVSKKTVKLSKGEADDDPTNLADAVKTASQWFDYIVKQYTSTDDVPFRWVYGFRPYYNSTSGFYEYRFFLKDPAKISQAVGYKFYPTWDRAQAALVTAGSTYAQSVESAYYNVHQNLELTVIEPEANALVFIGMDDTEKPILAYAEDKKSQDSTLPYNSQPANWTGDRRLVVIEDSSFNTPQLTVAGAGKLAKRLFRTRQRVEFAAEWHPDIRLWDTIEVQYNLAGDDNPVNHQFRVTGFSSEHKLDPNQVFSGMHTHIPCRYTAERWYSVREI